MSRKAFLIACGIIIAALIAMAVLAISDAEEKTWDTCYPMTNVNVSWQQTFHSGAWN